jgi:putative endonuclease
MVEVTRSQKYCVYVIKGKDGWLYVGHTGNIEERLTRHNEGEVRSTKNRGPFELVYSEEYKTRGEAMKRERFLKTPEGGLEKRKILKEIGA